MKTPLDVKPKIMARHNVIYIEAWCARDISLGLACTRHGFDSSISLANLLPSSSRHQIEQIPRKTFSRLLPISPPPSDLSRLIHPVASIVSLFKAGGILSPHLWTRHHIRKCLFLCLNFANCWIKTSHNRGQIYSNKVVSYCYFRGISS